MQRILDISDKAGRILDIDATIAESEKGDVQRT